MEYDISSFEQLAEAAGAVHAILAEVPFAVVLLEGELGAGKTTLTQTLAGMFGVQEEVQSPTYSLLRVYELPDGRVLHHLDLYRVEDRHELDVAGISELLLAGKGLFIIEWPRFLEDLLASCPTVLYCHLAFTTDGKRTLTLR